MGVKSSWLLGLLMLLAAPGYAQWGVLTQHNDNLRTGANLNETVLNTSNVNADQFGMLFSRDVDDEICVQPLYVAHLNVPNSGYHNIVYVATVNNTVYAFDADDPEASEPLWQVNLGPAVPITDLGTSEGSWCDTYHDFSHLVGITGTPVIDPKTSTLYVAAKSKENGSFFHRLHALDLATGQERPGSPVTIQASISGRGVGSSRGIIPFNAQTANQRPALALSGGVVYVGFGSHCDAGPFHGWLLGYNAATLHQVSVFNATPDGDGGGIWQAGQGPAVDATGDIYLMTGNGSFNYSSGGKSLAMSVLRLRPGPGQQMEVLDWFTPFNWRALNGKDRDLGSTGPLLVPSTDLVLGCGKSGVLYLLNKNSLGHIGSPATGNPRVVQEFQAVQSIQGAPNAHLKGSPVYWNSPKNGPTIYIWGQHDHLRAYRLAGGTLQVQAVGQSPMTAPMGAPGAMMSLSAYKSTPGTGILWTSAPYDGDANQAVVPGVLRAFDASDVSRELWNSKHNATRDNLGNFAKFSYPTIANGKVYAATFSRRLCVYGLFPPRIPAPPTDLAAAPLPGQVRLFWTPSPGAISYNIKRSTAGGPYLLVGTGVRDANFTDTGLVPDTHYAYQVSAVNGFGESEESAPAAIGPPLPRAAPAAGTR